MSPSNKEQFRVIFHLSQNQPWLMDRYEELENLLWNECDSEDKRNLVIDLIDRFEYLSSQRYAELIDELAESVTTDPELVEAETQLVALAADSGADSSQYVLYNLKTALEKLGWRKYKQVNQFSKSFREYKKNNSLKRIVLIDEFVGSGQTVVSRVDEIRRVYQQNGVDDLKICVKVVAATEEGISRIRGEGIDIDSLISLKKGISGEYEYEVARSKIELMCLIENKLYPYCNEEPLPSLGYGQVEALYCRDGGNVPNSVFPIFWWPFSRDGNERPVLLTRAMG